MKEVNNAGQAPRTVGQNPKQYEGLGDKGMSKQRAAAISNANAKNDNASSRRGGCNGHT